MYNEQMYRECISRYVCSIEISWEEIKKTLKKAP
jgi:hypothetical protein